MSIYNKIAGNYYLVTVEPDTGEVSSDNIIVETNTFKVKGNLSVTGDTTMINVEETTIEDPYIVLGSNNDGEFPEVGIIAQTDTDQLAGLRYNSITTRWEVSDDVDLQGNGIYQTLATTEDASPGGNINSVQFNAGGDVFGGADYFTIDTSNNVTSIDGAHALLEQETEPNSVANATVVYGGNAGLGDSGVFVKSTTDTDEIVAYKRAKKLALIL